MAGNTRGGFQMKNNDSVYVPDEPPAPYGDAGKKAYDDHQKKAEKAMLELEKKIAKSD